MTYPLIADHGLIGNLHTVALVCTDGTLDWFCYPQFDSPSIFGSILDHEKGGFFSITSTMDDVTTKQLYWSQTNVLVTRFLSEEGVGEVIDYMPVSHESDLINPHRIVRRVRAVRGTVHFEVICRPAFNYAQDDHTVEVCEHGANFYASSLNMALTCTPDLQADGQGGVRAIFELAEGESTDFVFWELPEQGICPPPLSDDDAEALFNDTIDYWRKWLSQCTYAGRWREIVYRSALVLKLLTFQPTGAIVASPTTSLPEEMGGVRNWDYRYTWIRDAAFTLYGLIRIGFTEEAKHFIEWVEARTHEPNPDGSLQIMYSIDGDHNLTERTLDHLEGYAGSDPVRVGNGAADQLQLDIYGELMDAIYLYNKYGEPISYDLWRQLRKLVNWVCDNWTRTDEGIWEVRGGQQHFVYSKLMCWVAVDRGLRLASKRSFPADRDRWEKVRDEIYLDIMEHGWNEEIGAFVQYYGSDTLDASNLIMPLVFFISPTDPRMLQTLDAIRKPPHEGGLVSDSLVFRYNTAHNVDGLDGSEGTFNMCTFWLIEALTRAGKVDEARLMFEQMLGYANHLGLYAEETGFRGEALGNFPQAFTHLALISAAFNLDRALGSRA